MLSLMLVHSTLHVGYLLNRLRLCFLLLLDGRNEAFIVKFLSLDPLLSNFLSVKNILLIIKFADFTTEPFPNYFVFIYCDVALR